MKKCSYKILQFQLFATHGRTQRARYFNVLISFYVVENGRKWKWTAAYLVHVIYSQKKNFCRAMIQCRMPYSALWNGDSNSTNKSNKNYFAYFSFYFARKCFKTKKNVFRLFFIFPSCQTVLIKKICWLFSTTRYALFVFNTINTAHSRHSDAWPLNKTMERKIKRINASRDTALFIEV